MRNTPTYYGHIAVFFHWSSALLILTMIALGVIMHDLPDDVPRKAALYRAHVGIGLIVLGLTALRLIWFFVDKHPAPPENMTPWRKRLFQWIHRLQYLVLVLLLASGMMILRANNLSFSPAQIDPSLIQDVPPASAHDALSKVFMVLLIMHVGGVISYQMSKGNTLGRMGLGRRPSGS